MEVYEILEYKREHDCWVCPECDAENSLLLGKCLVCGWQKKADAKILKAWSEEDKKTAPPQKKVKSKLDDSPIFKEHDDNISKEHDEHITSTEKSYYKGLMWFAIILVIVILIVAIIQGNSYASYSNAMNEFHSGNYELAIDLFEKLPSNYKDVSHMLNESKYQYAMECLNAEDFMLAESLFESIRDYNDSANMVKECRYRLATSLFDLGNYTEAKTNFLEISSYLDSKEMVQECDYMVATNYKNNADYVKAMKAFNDLGNYKDSTQQFVSCENALISVNKKNGYCQNENSMFGTWSDSNGNYVTYTNQGNGSVNANYNIENTDGEFFKLSNGVHYHGNDYNGWKKQWIYQMIDNNKVQVYDYISGEIYNLSRK